MSFQKLVLLLLVLALPHFILLPDRFSPAWIVSDVTGNFAPFHCPEIEQITAQPLTYLGHGLQSIAFASTDGRYVLKFFLKGKFRKGIRLGRKTAPPPHRVRYDLLHRYDLAFREMRNEAGLLAVHLATTHGLPSCIVKDPQGNKHLIDLNRTSFVVQLRGTPLSQLPSQKKRQATPLLEQLLISRAKKGFTDAKERLNEQNFALLDGQAIMVDVGNVIFSEELRDNPANEMERVRNVLERWAKENAHKSFDYNLQ